MNYNFLVSVIARVQHEILLTANYIRVDLEDFSDICVYVNRKEFLLLLLLLLVNIYKQIFSFNTEL